MRRKWWVVVVAAVVAAIFLWPRRQHDAGVAQKARAARSLEHFVHAGDSLSWLGQPGVAGRRIAGRVTHAGVPVPKALVRLTTEELHIGEWTLASVWSDDQGRFDFGTQPATRFSVVASADGLAPADEEVDLRRPDRSDALEIELRDCSLLISGTVRDAAGGTIAQAHVRAGTAAGVILATVADAEGHYRVCSTAGSIHVEASADGYGTAFEHRQNAHGEALVDFALSPEVVIAGRVTDDSGGPVEGATVVAATNGHDPGAYAETDSEGRFRLDGLGVGPYRVIAREADRVAQKPVDARPPGRTFELALTLAERAPIKGRVVAGGVPVVGATVTVERPGRFRRPPITYGSAVSQADGTFVVAGLPSKEQVVFNVEGYKVKKPAAPVEVANLETVELDCERLAKVSGRVVRNGAPVAETSIVLSSARDGQRATSKADGTFRFEGVGAGSWSVSAESIAAESMASSRTIEVGTADIDKLVVELDLSASIAGTVVDETGAPVAGVYVAANGGNDGGSDVTAKDGSFKCVSLAGSRGYNVTVRRDVSSYLPLEPAPGTTLPLVQVPDGKTAVTGIRVAITRGVLKISGKVVRGGQPVVGRDVHARANRGEITTQTLADGTFMLADLTAGTYRVGVGTWGRRAVIRKEMEVEAGAKDLVIELPPAGAIEGELRGFSGDVGLDAQRGPDDRVMSRDTGQVFTMDDLAAGEWVLNANGEGGGRATAKVTVVENQTTHVVLEAGPTGHLDAVVTDWRTGAPISRGACSWRSEDGGHGTLAELAADGSFSADVPAGPIHVDCYAFFRHRSQPAKSTDLDLPAGGSAHRDIQLLVARNELQEGQQMPFSIGGDPLTVQGAEAGTGLQNGDRILSVNGDAIAGVGAAAVSFLLEDHPAGQPVSVVVERDGERLSFDIAPKAH